MDEDGPEFLGCRWPAEAALDVLAALCMGDPFLGQISLLMLLFGIGAAAPLILLGSFSRAGLTRLRGRLLLAGRYGKQLFGLVMLCLGVLIATGTDRTLEAWILDRSPAWLTALTTRY